MARNNKICALCGTAYKYCGGCREDMHLPIWKNTFCSQECLDVYEAMVGYVNGHSSKEATKAVLMKYQASGKYQNYKKSFAKTYEEVMTDAETKSEIEEKKEAITTEDITKQMAVDTASQIKTVMTAENKKFYPNAVAHKHGK